MPRAFVNGVNLYYEVSGTGPSVVLCHGYTASHQDWMSQIPALFPKYQVVAMDHRGHGSTDAPSSADAYSIPIFASDVHALLEHLGISKCCLLGHSMGGFIALHSILEHPHLVSSMVLVDTASGPFEIPGYTEIRAKLIEIARQEGMEAAFEYNIRHNPMVQKQLDKYPELRELTRRRMLETSVDGYIYAGKAMAQREDLTPRLGEISAPTLIIVGEEDTPFRQPSEVMAKAIPNARLEVVTQATHTPQEETPELFNKLLLDFLAEVESI